MILCLVEHEAGVPALSSLEALTLARRLAERADEELHAVAFPGDSSGEEGGPIAGAITSLQGALAGHFVGDLHLLEGQGLLPYAPRAWARALGDLTRTVGAGALLASATERGSEVLAYLGALEDLPVAANCIEVFPGTAYDLERLRFGGSVIEEATLVADGPKLLSIAVHGVAVEEPAGSASPEIRRHTVTLDDRDLALRVASSVEPERSGISLNEAHVVVGGGRGVGSEEGFALLEELAGLLGGTVGVSRAVTSLGWRPHREQVGQTGTRISPDLYFACGISGAIQHMAGCKSARRILAINSDPDAAIMSQADYVVIGDLHDVLGEVVRLLREESSAGT